MQTLAGTTAPLNVITIHPARQRIDAPANGNIQVKFDEFIDPATVNAVSVRVFGRWSGPATGTIDVEDSTVTFAPSTPFFAGEYVTVSLSSAIADTSGEAMSHGYAWSFWVATSAGTLDLNYLTRYTVRDEGGYGVQVYGAYAGDLDGDGWCDLVVPCERMSQARVFRNDGAGLYGGGFTVVQLTSLCGPSPNDAGDFDNDSNIDMVVGCHGSDQVNVLRGDGTGTFPQKTAYTADQQVRAVGVLDANGDGWDDIVATGRLGSSSSGNISLLLNIGDGTFAPRINIEAGVNQETSLAVADADNDGIMDLFVGSYTVPRTITVLLGDGNGGFVPQTPVSTLGLPWMLAVGDVNGDHNVDVFSAGASGGNVAIHFGDGSGGISAATLLAMGGQPIAIDAGDIDGDGDLELAASNNAGSWVVWENAGGSFVNPRTLLASTAGSCATLHDRDNDGDLDLTGVDEVDDWVYLFENISPWTPVHTPPPAAATMEQNYPNPFNPSTTIHFALTRGDVVNLSIFDAAGSLVTTLVDARYPAGEYDVRWDGTDARGHRVASGFYFCRLEANGVAIKRKMTLLK
ncbi:MAG TPA: FG-GAP-like repeat-containing protein [Candidatus Krumholzibacteria bacterium]|nr:FG-GAP-like repeat-containing protein [Candidatus Krumholzibacteria bacterium]